MKAADVITDLLIAPIAGFAGTKVMEPVSMGLYNLESPRDRAQEDAVRPGVPFEIAAKKTLGALGFNLEGPALERAGLAFHYGLAIGWAPVYALLRRTTPLNPLAAGLVSGAAMSLLIDEGMTPMIGFSAPDRAYPASTHVRGFIAHLVFGLAIAAVTETAWALSGLVA
jgi:uncharacterized membrane protein YagU involved in acid resistance